MLIVQTLSDISLWLQANSFTVSMMMIINKFLPAFLYAVARLHRLGIVNVSLKQWLA